MRTTELKILASKATQAGFKTSGTSNAGGWVSLAKSCGVQATTKGEARAGLRVLLTDGVKVKPTAAAAQSVRIATVVSTDAFLSTFEWRRLRMKVIKHYGPVCMCCAATPATGAVINVDHIKPRRLFPELALDFDNLQVLCHDCNHGKGNWDQTDWRPKGAARQATGLPQGETIE